MPSSAHPAAVPRLVVHWLCCPIKIRRADLSSEFFLFPLSSHPPTPIRPALLNQFYRRSKCIARMRLCKCCTASLAKMGSQSERHQEQVPGERRIQQTLRAPVWLPRTRKGRQRSKYMWRWGKGGEGWGVHVQRAGGTAWRCSRLRSTQMHQGVLHPGLVTSHLSHAAPRDLCTNHNPIYATGHSQIPDRQSAIATSQSHLPPQHPTQAMADLHVGGWASKSVPDLRRRGSVD